MKKNLKNFQSNRVMYVAVVFVAVVLSLYVVRNVTQGQARQELTYSEMLSNIDTGSISSVVISGRSIEGRTADGRTFSSYIPLGGEDLLHKMEKKNVSISAKERESGSMWGVILSWVPMLLFIGIWLFSLRSMQKGAGGFGLGRVKPKTLASSKTVKFSQVGGMKETREQVEEFIRFLKSPKQASRLGGRIPRGCLLVGPPGNGKTLLGKAVAGEASVPFFFVAGSEFVELFVGIGSSRVRNLFAQAREQAPCILFIDEIDAVGKKRGGGMGQSQNDEREQTLNQLLIEMDGMEPSLGVVVMAATNRQDVLDGALLRSGRFDRHVHVGFADIKGRKEIMEIHIRNKKVPVKDVDLLVMARSTVGFSGADLENLVNEAALKAAIDKKQTHVLTEHFEYARDKTMMGVERRAMSLTEEDRKLIAYHEAGHALVAVYTRGADPIHKATIVPRGSALGMVMQVPERDMLSLPLYKIHAKLDVAMGGRVAEEIIFGHDKVTTGAMSDIQMATSMANSMVTQWGLSETLGPVQYKVSNVFEAVPSQETVRLIDKEVLEIVRLASQRAKKLLTKRIDELRLLAQALLEHETLSGEDVKRVLDGSFKKTGSEKTSLVDKKAVAGGDDESGDAGKKGKKKKTQEDASEDDDLSVPVVS